MLQYAVVFFLKANVAEINAFREQYDPNWHVIAPHITLMSPLSEVSENQLVEHVENVINTIVAFPMHQKGVTKTLDGHLFLLLAEGNEKIITLHDVLYSGAFFQYLPTDFPFIPHVTLGEFKTNENELLEKAYREAQNLPVDEITMFDSVSIIKGDGIHPAEIVKTINLHK